MNVRFRKSFLKDIKGLSGKALKHRVKAAITEVEAAGSLQDVSNVKKLKGSQNYFRLRIGNYRIALICEGQNVTFVRCLHRREIYRFLP